MAGFSYRKNLDGSAYNPVNMYGIGVNSGTFTVGDPVRIDNEGFISLADAITDGIAGICVSVVDKNHLPVAYDTGTLDTWTLNSANETDTNYQYEVAFIPALPNYLFYNDADNDLARTNLFQFFNITAGSSQIDVATATDTANEQFRLIELDPDHDGDASKGLFQVVESQLAPVSLGAVAQ